MRRGRKPTYEQRKLLLKNGYEPAEWLVIKNTTYEMVIVSRQDGITTASVKKI